MALSEQAQLFGAAAASLPGGVFSPLGCNCSSGCWCCVADGCDCCCWLTGDGAAVGAALVVTM